MTSFLQITAAIVGIIWVLSSIYSFVPTVVAPLLKNSRQENDDTDISGLSLPTIDVLIPAYREGDAVQHSISSINEAEYPASRLNPYVLLEPGDTGTRSALEALADDYRFTVIEVPDSYPGDSNKPRALNFGFELTDSDIVGIIDAENIVESDLFVKVATSFERYGAEYVQGKVDMVNERDGWINTLFRAEYGLWYQYVIPAFYRLNLPIPLSGTTCFFGRELLMDVSTSRSEKYGTPWNTQGAVWLDAVTPRSALPDPERPPTEAIGDGGTEMDDYAGEQEAFEWIGASPSTNRQTEAGSGTFARIQENESLPDRFRGLIPWDPTNVTEDFELGLSLWTEDRQMGIVDSCTLEESPEDVDGWLKQRTRWQKGKLQTFYQFVRNPPKGLSAKFHILWQSVLPHIGGLNIIGAIFLLLIANLIPWRPAPTVNAVLLASLLFVPINAIAYAAGYVIASDQSFSRRIPRVLMIAVTLPGYWVLQWMADVRAMNQIYLGQLHWEKTVHSGSYGQNDSLSREQLFSTVRNWLQRYRWLLAVIALALGLRLYNLGGYSYWLDEIYSVAYRGQLNPAQIVSLNSELHPPLYYLTIHYWIDAFGTNPVSTRLLSVLAGVGMVGAVYFLGDELYDHTAGLIAASLVAVSAAQINQSQTARMYSMFVLFGVLSLYYCLKIVQTGRSTTTIWYSIATLLMIYTHIFAVFVLFAQNVYVLYEILSHRRFDTRLGFSPGQWIASQGLLALMSIPWMLVIGRRLFGVTGGQCTGAVGWIPAPTLYDLKENFLIFMGYPDLWPKIVGNDFYWSLARLRLLFVVAIVIVAPTYLYISRPNERRVTRLLRRNLLPLLVILSVVIIPFVVSVTVTPMFNDRYTFIAGVCIAVLVGGSLSQLPNKRIAGLCVAVLLVSSAFFTGIYLQADSEEPWESTTHRIEQQSDPGDSIVLHPWWINTSYGYYTSDTETTLYNISRGGGMPSSNEAVNSNTPTDDTVFFVSHYKRGTRPVLDRFENAGYTQQSYNRSGILEVYRFNSTNATAPVGAVIGGPKTEGASC